MLLHVRYKGWPPTLSEAEHVGVVATPRKTPVTFLRHRTGALLTDGVRLWEVGVL